MPELPEVETIRLGLSKLLPGKTVRDISFDWSKSFPNAVEDVDQFLVGACITEVKRRAKVLLIELSSKHSLVIHLKMTGQLVYVGENVRFGAGHPNESLISELPNKTTHVIFDLEWEEPSDSHLDAAPGSSEERTNRTHGTESERKSVTDNALRQEPAGMTGSAGQQGKAVRNARLFFNDQRKFGWVRLIPTTEVPNMDFMKKVGPEPLAADFTAKIFRERLARRKNISIKAALLDQTVIAGVGNIYADEALWSAKIYPATIVQDIPIGKLNKLFHALQDVLSLSIEKGGSTDKNYVDAEGNKGSYLSFANVFRRNGQLCPRCGTTIEKMRVAGRGTHFCIKCQRSPKV